MNRLLTISLLWLFACACSWAQINLREGIVITLQGDTLQGDIDYRSDFQNAQRCVFVAPGATAPTTYLPGEIQGYRFTDNGRYYVSKEVPTHADSEFKKMAFVEFVVRGNVSFYYISDRNSDLFLLDDADGKLVAFDDVNKDSSLSQRRKKLTSALLMLGKSKKAQEKLWRSDMEKNQIKKITLLYNDDVCPDGQCEVYEYPAAKTPVAEQYVNWLVKAGYSPQLFRVENHTAYFPDVTTATCPGYRISGGIEIRLARYCKGLYIQVIGNFAQAGKDNVRQKVLRSDKMTNAFKYKYTELSAQLGAAYEFPIFRTPAKGMVFAGYDISSYKHQVECSLDYYNTTDHVFNAFRSHYFGARLSYPIGRHSLLVEAQFYHKLPVLDNWPNKRPSFMLGWKF